MNDPTPTLPVSRCLITLDDSKGNLLTIAFRLRSDAETFATYIEDHSSLATVRTNQSSIPLLPGEVHERP